MKHEMKLATLENIVTALCLCAGVILIVLALYTLIAVKSVQADRPTVFGIEPNGTLSGEEAASRRSRHFPSVPAIAPSHLDGGFRIAQ